MAHKSKIIVCGSARDIVRSKPLPNHNAAGPNPLPAFECQFCGVLFIVGDIAKDVPPDHECPGPHGRVDF